jgi:hypothetical protein
MTADPKDMATFVIFFDFIETVRNSSKQLWPTHHSHFIFPDAYRPTKVSACDGHASAGLPTPGDVGSWRPCSQLAGNSAAAASTLAATSGSSSGNVKPPALR